MICCWVPPLRMFVLKPAKVCFWVSENQALCRRLCSGNEGGTRLTCQTQLLLEKAPGAHESKIIAPKSDDGGPILEHNKMLRSLPQGH